MYCMINRDSRGGTGLNVDRVERGSGETDVGCGETSVHNTELSIMLLESLFPKRRSVESEFVNRSFYMILPGS